MRKRTIDGENFQNLLKKFTFSKTPLLRRLVTGVDVNRLDFRVNDHASHVALKVAGGEGSDHIDLQKRPRLILMWITRFSSKH